MAKIIGLNDGKGGRNEHYKIKGEVFTRRQVIKEIKQGKHSGAHVYEINGEEYARDNPDNTKSDNVNRNK